MRPDSWNVSAKWNESTVFNLGGETPIYTGTWCAAYMGRFFEPTLHEQGIFSGCFRGCLTWAGCLFGADLRIWDDSFLSVVEMQFFLINYVCIIITMLPKIVIMIQYFLSLTWAGYVFCIIRSRPYISGSSFPDLGRTSRLLAYLVNPPRATYTSPIIVKTVILVKIFCIIHYIKFWWPVKPKTPNQIRV